MATRRFSTGLPKLDNYIGGLLPGDALLTFVSQNAHGNDLISSIIGYASASHIPLLYISLDDCYKREIGQYSKLKYINISPTLKPPTIVKTVKRFLSKYARDGYLITDDLSSWKKYLHSDRKVNDLYTVLTAFAEQRRIVLACTASRGAFSRETLANLKDVSTICLDFIRYGGNEYCVPLSLRGRYISHGILPLRFQLYELTSPVRENPSSEVELSSLLTEKQSKELDALLMNDERKYLQIFHGSAEAMVLFDLDGDYREINKQMETILGYSSAEFRLIPPTSIVLPSERIRFLRKIVELQRRKRGFITLTVAKKNGKHLPIEFHASNISDDLYLGILHDITESQQREMALLQREEEYQRLVEGLPFPIIVSHNRKILFVNSAFFKMFGYSKDDGMGVWAINDLLTPESMRTYQKTLRERTSFVEPFTFEVHCLRRDGTVFESELTLTDIPFRGKKCLHHSLVDISTTKGLVEKLTASEERYRTLVETSSQPVTIIREGKFIFANKAFYELFGFETDQQVIDHDISLVVADDERERFAETMRKRLSSKGLSTIEFGGVRTDGKNITIELVLHPVQEHESPVLLGFYYDRTTDQQIKRELHQRTSEMALLKEVLPALQSSLDAHRLEQAAMHRIMDVLSWASGGIYTIDEKSKQFVLGYHRNMSDVLVRKLSSMSVDEGIGGYLYKTLEPRVFSTDHYPSYLPHRSSFRDAGFQKVCFLPLVSHEKLVGLIILGAKKDTPALASESVDLLTAIGNYLGNALATAKAHREISESEKKKHRLIDSSPNVLYIALPTGSFVSVNAGIERLVGYSPKDFSRNPSLWLKVVHPDDKKILLERTTQLHGLGERSVTEYRVLPKGKALYRWVQDVVSIVRDDSGNVTELLGEICDITEQKVLIDQLRDESVLHTNILFSVPEGVVVFDRSLKCLKWNNAMENITSIREEDVLGKDVVKSLPGVDGQEFEQMIRTVMRGEVVTSRDLPYTVSGTKNVGYLWGRFSPLHNAEGNITGIIGVFTDISARKSLETEMRESEQVLTNVIDTMGDILVVTDLRGKVLQVNRAFLRTLGYARADAVGVEFPYPWLIEEEMGRFVLWISNLRERNWLHDFDMTWKAMDGRLISMSLSTTLLRNSLGEPIAMLNIARDITERTLLTKDLEKRTKQIEMINRIISKANQTLDFDEIFGVIAKEIMTIIPADVISVGVLNDDHVSLRVRALTGHNLFWNRDVIPVDQSISQYAIRDQKPVIIHDLLTHSYHTRFVSLDKGLRSHVSLPILLKGKAFGTLNVGSKEPHSFSDDHVKILAPIAQQIGAIIDRISLFNQVTEDASYIHNLLDSIDSIVYTVDTHLSIREVNKAWDVFMHEQGVQRLVEYHGKHLFDMLPSETLKVTYQNVVDRLLNGTLHIFSQEYVHRGPSGERVYQLTINPMIIDTKITGLVFTHTDITALKKSEEELKKGNEQLLALNEISSLISTSFDLDEMLHAALPLIRKVIDATAVIVYLQESVGDLVCAHQVGFSTERLEMIRRLSPTESATGEVIRTKQPLYISEQVYIDYRILPQNRAVLKEDHLEAMAVIPLISKDKVLGALDIFFDSRHVFTAHEQQLLTLIGNQLGAAIENVQLYSELRFQIDRLTVLFEFSQQLTSTLNIDEIFRVVYENVHHIIPYERFSIDLYDDAAKTKSPAFCIESRDGEQIFITTLSEPTVIVTKSPEWNVVSRKHSFQSGDKRAMYVPMLSKGSIIGIMSVRAGQQTTYTDIHLKLLESISNLAAIALEKGKLYEETVQKSLEIQRRNKELDDFTYVVSHDLKEPLISIEGFSRILQADYHEIIQPEGKEYFDSIVGATTRMKGLIDDLLLLSRISRPSESFKPVDLKTVINDIATDLEFTIRQKGAQIVIPDELPTIFGNETHLKIVFRNLIGNAIKFNDKPNPRVEIGFQNAENNSYLFTIKDNGIGIDKDFHEKIFVIFQRLHRREEYEGSGAGLAIVKKIIELHKGSIWVDSEPGKGSTFSFTLPKLQSHES